MVSPRRLSELIQLLYASVEDPAVWSRFLEGLAEEVGAGMTLLLAAPRKGGSVGISTAVRADPESLRAYAEEGWSERDLFATSGHPSVTQEGAVVITEEIVPSRDLVHTDFYNEFMRRFDMFHSVVATLLSDDQTSAGLAFHYNRRARLPDADQVELVSLLVPHLAQALRVHRRWAELEQAEHAATEALEHATTGFLFLDGRGTILRGNGRAEDVLRAGDGLFSRAGRLAARVPDDDRALQRAIRGAATTALAGGTLPGCTIAVRRGPARPPYVVAFMPVSAAGGAFLRHGAAVLAMVSDPAREPEVPARRLQRVFGWTAAEAEVAREVAAGARLRDVAERRGVGIETVRTQLKSVFRKAGVSSQAALARLLANASDALRSRRS